MQRRGSTTTTAALLAVLLLLGGCGSASEPSPPTGVDELVIPTPSITPRDFVAAIDNPWLPYRSGAAWTYDLSSQEIQGGTGSMDVRVRPGTTRVDGVATTAVQTTVRSATSADTTVDYYAQDRSGNVWWLGREGVWQAGRDGAEAGLAMPSHPRRGDGWRSAYQAGVVEDRLQVDSLEGEVAVPRGHFRHVLDLRATSDLAPGIVHERSYVRGVGLVREYAEDGPAVLVELVTGP